MRIAVTTCGSGPESLVAPRFLDARYILIFDTSTGRWESVRLSLWARQRRLGGKIRVSMLKEAGIELLISGEIDSASHKSLAKCGIRIIDAPACSARDVADMMAGAQNNTKICRLPSKTE